MAQKFLRAVSIQEIGATKKIQVALESLRREFGDNFNTLTLINTDTSTAIAMYLDGHKIGYVPPNFGVFQLEWRDGINYNILELENESGAAVSAGDIVATVGRTGLA